MADAVIRIGGNNHAVRLGGAQGPRGFNGPDLVELAGPTGADQIGFSAGVGAGTETVQQILRQQVRVTSYGASPAASGAANVAAFNAAAADAGVGGCVVVPFGTYALAGTVDIRADQQWRLEGAVLEQSANVPTLRATGVDVWSLIGGRIVGDRPVGDYDDDGQVGLLINDSVRFKVSGLTCENIAGAGFRQTSSISTGLRGEGGTFSDCAAFGCSIGRQLIAGLKSEFTSWTNWTASANFVGDDISAGNVSTNGGSISDNVDTGVRLTAGANEGHGGYSNVTIAHNGNFAVYAVGTLNGYLFNACRFYEKSIALIGCAGIVFSDGILAVETFYNRLNSDDESAGTNRIENMYCPASYGSVDIKRAEVEHDVHLDVTGCFGPGSYFGGVTINDPGPEYVHAARLRGSATQALVGTTTLIWPDVQQNGNRKGCLDESSGVVTIDRAGQRRIEATAAFLVTDTTVAGSVVALVHNGIIIQRFILGLAGTLLTASLVRNLYLNEGDTIEVRVALDGTTPVFGNSGSDSVLTIELIA